MEAGAPAPPARGHGAAGAEAIYLKWVRSSGGGRAAGSGPVGLGVCFLRGGRTKGTEVGEWRARRAASLDLSGVGPLCARCAGGICLRHACCGSIRARRRIGGVAFSEALAAGG